MLNRNYDPFFLDQNLFIYFSHFYCRLARGFVRLLQKIREGEWLIRSPSRYAIAVLTLT